MTYTDILDEAVAARDPNAMSSLRTGIKNSCAYEFTFVWGYVEYIIGFHNHIIVFSKQHHSLIESFPSDILTDMTIVDKSIDCGSTRRTWSK